MKALGTATAVLHEDGWTKVIYHNTAVVTFNDRYIILNHQGWRTQTTKRRMNQAAVLYNLPYHVFQSDFAWGVDYSFIRGIDSASPEIHSYTVPFPDSGLVIDRETGFTYALDHWTSSTKSDPRKDG